MLLLQFIINMFKSIASFSKSNYKRALLQVKNPTCKFYPGVVAVKTTFGEYNVIFDNCTLNCCTIDSYTYIQKKASIFNCSIGKFCSVATQVSIAPGSHPINCVTTYPGFYLKDTPLVKKYSHLNIFETSKKVVIGHDVWIGEHAIILDGIKIGTGAVIAAGAVVTKDVEPYAIVGGCPAKLIKHRFDKELRDALLSSEWWNKGDNWFSLNYSKFTSPIELLKFMTDDN
jgi:acetyltransferase-like isoleucine patch superfamily enzyme